jgi:hypothetical protein
MSLVKPCDAASVTASVSPGAVCLEWHTGAGKSIAIRVQRPVAVAVAKLRTESQSRGGPALCVVHASRLRDHRGVQEGRCTELSAVTASGEISRMSLPGTSPDTVKLVAGQTGAYLANTVTPQWQGADLSGVRSTMRPHVPVEPLVTLRWFDHILTHLPVVKSLLGDVDAGVSSTHVVGEVCVDDCTYVVALEEANDRLQLRVYATELTVTCMMWHPCGAPLHLSVADSRACREHGLDGWHTLEHGWAAGDASVRLAAHSRAHGAVFVLTVPHWQAANVQQAVTADIVPSATLPRTVNVWPEAPPLITTASNTCISFTRMSDGATVKSFDHGVGVVNAIEVTLSPKFSSVRVRGTDDTAQEWTLHRLDADPLERHVLEVVAMAWPREVFWALVTQLALESTQRESVWLTLSAMLTGSSSIAPTEDEGETEQIPLALSPLDIGHQLFSRRHRLQARQKGIQAPRTTAEALIPAAVSRVPVCFGLHLLFESFKLQRPLWRYLAPLGELVSVLATLLGWAHYSLYYANILVRPLPSGPPLQHVDEPWSEDTVLQLRERFVVDVLFEAGRPPLVDSVLLGIAEAGLPVGRHVDAGAVPAGSLASAKWPKPLHHAFARLPTTHPLVVAACLMNIYRLAAEYGTGSSDVGVASSIVEAVLESGWASEFVNDVLPLGVAHPIRVAMATCRQQPSPEWLPAMLRLIGRPDVMHASADSQTHRGHQPRDVLRTADALVGAGQRQTIGNLEDAEAVLLPAQYSQHWTDTRAELIQALLDTSRPIALPPSTDRSDSGQAALKQLTRRALAQPIGRGILSYTTRDFRSRDLVPIPPLVLNGQTADGLVITADASVSAAENILWPMFHNAVAAGLRFMPVSQEGQQLPRHWILHQARTATSPVDRAGVVLAAGLTRQLRALEVMDVYALLMATAGSSAVREPVAVAITLGLAVSYRGRCTPDVLNYLQLHVQSMVRTAADLDSTLNSQAAALVAIGFLYEGSANVWIGDMLLSELGRRPTDEHCARREGYKVAAGMGLGLTLLGLGRNHGLTSRGVDEQLWAMIEGGKRRTSHAYVEGVSDAAERFGPKPPDSFFASIVHAAAAEQVEAAAICNSVLEGAAFDPITTAPPAVIAMGLTYMQTRDEIVSRRLNLADGVNQLHRLDPTTAMLRTLCATLVRWPDTSPSRQWVYTCLPPALLQLLDDAAEVHPESLPHPERYSVLMVGHALAGAVLAMGLRFAGTLLQEAKVVIMDELKGFMAGQIGTSGVMMNLMQKNTNAFESCIAACTSALGLVMAGTADLDALALLRRLHRRNTPSYGEHMATSMAMGLLFLGGGRCTMSNTRESVAALLCAVYPAWPATPGDNMLHLQALRHLYVLAAVPRWVETVDVETGESVSVEARLILGDATSVVIDSGDGSVGKGWTPVPHGRGSQAIPIVTPCLLPDFAAIDRVELRSVQHYPLNIETFARANDQVRIPVLQRPSGMHTAANASGSTSSSSATERSWRDYATDLTHPRTSAVIGNALLMNFKLLNALTTLRGKPLRGGRTSGRGAMGPVDAVTEISREACAVLRKALQRRYGGLLVAPTDEQRQWIRRTLVERMDVCTAVQTGSGDDTDTAENAKWLSHALQYAGLIDPAVVADCGTDMNAMFTLQLNSAVSITTLEQLARRL